MAMKPAELSPEVLAFLDERHLASLTLAWPGDVHVTPVGFSWDPGASTARIITFAGSKKVRLLEALQPMTAALCQVDGGRWLTLRGRATVSADPEVNADAEARYARRYRPPADRGADRRTIVIAVEYVLGRG